MGIIANIYTINPRENAFSNLLMYNQFMNDCIFCKIINSEIPSYKIWENADFIAILDIFPISKGMSVVLPKKHLSSYILEHDKNITDGLMDAMKQVAKILDNKLPGIIRTVFIIEGLEIDHLHAKLVPYYKGNSLRDASKKAGDVELRKIHSLLTSKR